MIKHLIDYLAFLLDCMQVPVENSIGHAAAR
jgi:hypothetical protein